MLAALCGPPSQLPCAQLQICLQEEEERKMRKEYRPPDRRTALQLKADEDFAKRMQRQEQEIEKHQLAYFREAQRRQMTQCDMGGVPEQEPQVCVSVIWFHITHFYISWLAQAFTLSPSLHCGVWLDL